MQISRGVIATEAVVVGAPARTVVLASADPGLRQRLNTSLTALRWKVREASGGAEAMAQLEEEGSEALLVDSWLPDLEVGEFATVVRMMYPNLELLCLDGAENGNMRSPRRHELLHALREAQQTVQNDAPAWKTAPVYVPSVATNSARPRTRPEDPGKIFDEDSQTNSNLSRHGESEPSQLLPEMIGASAPMRELARLIRLVAPRSTTVLIEGETGTGKELVARAVHQLSPRAGKSFVVLNCAAIPEALLEAELFGHTRGAFTGAVQSRTGRIEAAHGGSLFLDEIGEMPLALQAKMLRFLECGELQRVGDNETIRVDVRIIAATHQPLEQMATSSGSEKAFRLDLYHRLAVFPVLVPALRDRMEDLEMLSEHILRRLGQDMPQKRLGPSTKTTLHEHTWPGNIRELMHVLERATILADGRVEIEPSDIRLRRTNI